MTDVWIVATFAADDEEVYGVHVYHYDEEHALVSEMADEHGWVVVNVEGTEPGGPHTVEATDHKERVRMRARKVTIEDKAAKLFDRGTEL
jgi:hypothetical protein